MSNLVQGHLTPLLYEAPSAVSHQSRIDIKHTPLISQPLFYSPVTLVATPAHTIVTPIIASDTVLTPISLSFYHNLPLARALEQTIPSKKVRETANKKERKPIENVVTQMLGEKAVAVTDVNKKNSDNETDAERE